MKEFLSDKNVPYTEHNVSEDERAREELVEKTGMLGTPVVIVGDEVVVGFDRGRLKELLNI